MVATTHAPIVIILVSSVISLYVILTCFVNTRAYVKTKGELMDMLIFIAAARGGKLAKSELVSK